MKYTTEHIENYLLNNMSISEKIEFENELLNNVELQNELNAQKLAMEVIEFDGIKGDIESIINGANWINWIKKTFISLVGITALFFVALFIFDKKPKQSSLEISKLDTVSTVLDTTLVPDSSIKTSMVKRDFTYGQEENTSLFEQKNDDEIVSKKNDSINIKHKEKKQTHVSTNNFFEPQAYQIFEVDVNKPIKIEGKQGTIINIPANAICDEKGNQSNGMVTIKLQEFYQEIDLIKNKVPTVSNGFPIETGGAINIEVYKNNELLKLKKDSTYTIVFNSQKDDINPYSTFYGKREGKDSLVNWEVEEDEEDVDEKSLNLEGDYKFTRKRKDRKIKSNRPFTTTINSVEISSYNYNYFAKIDKIYTCDGGIKKKFDNDLLFNKINRICDSMNKIQLYSMATNSKGKFLVTLSFDTEGVFYSFNFKEQIDDTFKRFARKKLNQILNTKFMFPKDQCNNRFIEVNFGTSGITIPSTINFVSKFDRNDPLSNSNYLISKEFGFINCDRFMSIPGNLKGELKVKCSVKTQSNYILFQNEKVLMNLIDRGWNNYNAQSIPINSDLIIILFSLKDEKLMICIKEIGKNRKIEITESDFEEYDEEQLKDKIKEFKKS